MSIVVLCVASGVVGHAIGTQGGERPTRDQLTDCQREVRALEQRVEAQQPVAEGKLPPLVGSTGNGCLAY